MIRNFKSAILCLVLCLGFVSCSDDDDESANIPVQLEVNYINLAGNWQLINYNDHQLEQGTYMYITFERRDHVFQMYDNLQSMYGQKRTGTYSLTEDEDEEITILSGYYDHGVGEWNNEYIVSRLTATELHLTTTTEPQETSIYHRVDSLPEL